MKEVDWLKDEFCTGRCRILMAPFRLGMVFGVTYAKTSLGPQRKF